MAFSQFFFSFSSHRFQTQSNDIPGRNSWGDMESLGFRTAVLGQPLCKFLFADDSGVSGNLRQWSVRRSVSAFSGTYGELQNVYHDDSA